MLEPRGFQCLCYYTHKISSIDLLPPDFADLESQPILQLVLTVHGLNDPCLELQIVLFLYSSASHFFVSGTTPAVLATPDSQHPTLSIVAIVPISQGPVNLQSDPPYL